MDFEVLHLHLIEVSYCPVVYPAHITEVVVNAQPHICTAHIGLIVWVIEVDRHCVDSQVEFIF